MEQFNNFLFYIFYLAFQLSIVFVFPANGQNRVDSSGHPLSKEPFFLHQVKQGENLYALSRQYCTSLNEILAFNPDIKDYVVSIGQMLKIPRQQEPAACMDTLIPAGRFPNNAILYEVRKGETLYAISRMHDRLNIAKLREWNELKSDTLKTGQQLIVGWKIKTDSTRKNTPAFIAATTPVINTFSVPRADTVLVKEYRHLKDTTWAERQEVTIATWLPKTSTDDNGFYALHRQFPSGTIVRLRNPMNQEEVYVKVIGKLPDIGEHQNLQLKISAAAASQLGVLDSRFLVDLFYLAPAIQGMDK